MRKPDRTPPWFDPDRIAGIIAWAVVAILALAFATAGVVFVWSAITGTL